MGFAAFLPLIGGAVDKLLDLIPDTNARNRAEAEYQRAVLEIMAKESADQRDINKTEARHQNIFVAGWRPAIGWICAGALAFEYLVRPLIVWIMGLYWPGAPVPPSLDAMLWELMFGMLGIGGLRTFEKTRGVFRK